MSAAAMLASPLMASHAGARRAALCAVSIDASLLGSLRAAPGLERGRIHSVFAHTINVDRGSGDWLTLSSRATDNAPSTVVVDVVDWREAGFSVGESVAFAGADLVFAGGIRVALAGARAWCCELPPFNRASKVLEANLSAANDYLQRFGKGIGIDRALAAQTPFDRALAEAFAERRAGLCRAVAADDEAAIHRRLRELVGLGPGLTPAGDDFLVGFLAVLNLPGSPRPDWRRLGASVLACAATQTNAISLAALRHAARGEVRASVVRLSYALMQVETTPMLAALDPVMSLGASSGTDMALGMLSAFQLLLQTKR